MTFVPGQRMATATVGIIDDSEVENQEELFYATLSTRDSNVALVGRVNITIEENDGT